MTMEFVGKIVVVSGGSSGIGFAIAHAFALRGAQTALISSSEAKLSAAAERIVEGGSLRPLTIKADLRELSSCEHAHDQISERFGQCDVLVNSAGATRAGAFLTQSDTEWQDGFALKFYSSVRLCRLFWPMLKASQGVVLNIIGGAARVPDPEFLVGGAVNGAMANFTKGLAGLGKRDGVNVNAILPGPTETDRLLSLFEQRAAAAGSTVDEVKQSMAAQDGVRRLGRPEDIAELAAFLASTSARHIQGTSIAVDGGASPSV
jgi:3-oxoacyl-[acyl-carrier protein] reductase